MGLILELKNKQTTTNLESIITTFQILCKELKGMESRFIFFPNLKAIPLEEKEIWTMNSLHQWNQRTGFGFWDQDYANKTIFSCSEKYIFKRAYFSGHSLKNQEDS